MGDPSIMFEPPDSDRTLDSILPRDIIYDRVTHQTEMADRERQYRQTIWMLVISSGGEIRVPPSVIRDVNDPGDLTVNTDQATGELVFIATLYADGVKGL